MILFDPDGANSLGEALGSIFTILFTIPAVILSALPTLISNVLSVLLFRRITRVEEARPILYRVFFIISVVLLCLGIVLGVLDVVSFFGR